MENIEIAEHLTELADLLEIQGANPFRIRAYRNAVRTLRGLTQPVSQLVADGEDLTELPGIGDDLSGHIRELLDTGGLELLEELAREVPRELAMLTRLEGVGPKKVKKLWERLGVTTLDELEEVAHAGKVEALEGFGKKSVEKMLRSAEEFRKRRGRFLRASAVQYLRPLLEHMEQAPGLERLEVAGSYRRGKDTVGDIDLLAVVGEAPEPVMEHFTGFSRVERVVMSGSTRGSVVLASGLPVDLRIVPETYYGAAIHYFTGSKEHNVEVRKEARRRGLRISEYGVFRMEAGNGVSAGGEEDRGRSDGPSAGPSSEGEPHPDPERGERIAGATEEELFESVELPWIPPVLREGRGEIEAAREGRLPRLVELEDIRGDLHMHSTWSDGRESIRRMAEACRDRGYEYLAITDHSQAVTVAGGLTPERVLEQAEEVRALREELEGIHLFHGCEVDVLKDGSLDLPDEVLNELDLVLIAVHSHFHLDRVAQTERVIRGLSHPKADILVHPTGRLLTRRDPYALDVEAVLEAAAEHDVAVELNANPLRLDLHDRHLFRARELRVTVSLATDAHRLGELGYIEGGLTQAQRGWLEADDVLNTRPLGEVKRWLNRKKG